MTSAGDAAAETPGAGLRGLLGKTGLAALALGVCLRLFLAAVLPSGAEVGFARLEGLNDEPSHFNYVRFLSDSLRFPVQVHAVDAPGAFQRNDFEYYQPPLYYLTGGLLNSVFSPRVSLYLCRLLSVLCGVATILVLGSMALLLGCPHPVGGAVMLFTALLPSHAYFSSVVSNDSLSWLIAAMLVREGLLVLHADRGAMLRQGVRIGVLLAAGMLTKTSVLLLYPFIAAAYGCRFWRERDRKVLTVGSAALLASLVVVAPWYLRNVRLYGSLTGFSVACGRPRVSILEFRQFVDFLK